MISIIEKYCQKWQLQAISQAWQTHTSILQKAQMINGRMALLKCTEDIDECRGAKQVFYWQGNQSIVTVFEQAECAYLMDYALDSVSLMSNIEDTNQFNFASQILGQTAQNLHQQDLNCFDSLHSLDDWFADFLHSPALFEHHAMTQQVSADLLANPISCVCLHGDLHHDNVLQFADGAWRAIDPKGLQGEHYFDYVLALVNPALPKSTCNLDWFSNQRALLCQQFSLEHSRLTAWVKAYLGLSIFWFLEDEMLAEAQQQMSWLDCLVAMDA